MTAFLKTYKNLVIRIIFTPVMLFAFAACGSAPVPSPDNIPVIANTVMPTDVPQLAQNTSIGGVPSGTPAQAAPSNSACSSPAKSTAAMTEGPYFKAGSPERSSLVESNTNGTRLILHGTVFDLDCKPVADALLDFWQADANGVYDNSGYMMRGHMYTDANGNYQLTTVVPRLYTGRTEHIHVKVQSPNGPVLTTQLFFPGVVQNDSDQIFDASLLIDIQKNADGETGTYNFVISTK